jgi:hypothetical protein
MNSYFIHVNHIDMANFVINMSGYHPIATILLCLRYYKSMMFQYIFGNTITSASVFGIDQVVLYL